MRDCLLLLLGLVAALPARAEEPAAVGLGAASLAYREGRFETCATLAGGIDPREVRNPDVARLLEGQCWFYAGNRPAARMCFERLVREHPESPFATLAEARAADCSWEQGDHVGAAQAYRRLEARGDAPGLDRAVGWHRRVEAAFEAGKEEEAWRTWFELRARHPDHPLAGVPPGDRLPRPISVADALRVAGALHRQRRWQEALDVLDSAPTPDAPQQRFELAFRAGRILFDMPGRKPEAARMLFGARDHALDSRQAEEAWFWGSRSVTRAGRVDDSIRSHLDMVTRYPQGRRTPEALFYAGWLTQDEARVPEALPLLERTWREHPGTPFADDARWFGAWCQIQMQHWKQAIPLLAPQRTHPSPSVAGRALYWTAQCHDALGNADQAKAIREELDARFPLTWYSALARLRAGAPPLQGAPPAASPWNPIADPLLERSMELVGAGLAAPAATWLEWERIRFLQRHPGQEGLRGLLDAFRQAGDFHQPYKLAVLRGGDVLRVLPTADSHPMWEHAYPRCARDSLQAHAQGDQTLVLFAQAIMRSESAFDPSALSIADARGLMQLTPKTGERAAQNLGLPFDPADLFDPETNVRLATHHLARLVKKFHGQWPIVAAAYNAGTPAVIKWLRARGQVPLDTFVESIPFQETRGYVKTVFEALLRYAYLEGAPPPALSLTLNPEFQEDDIDY